MENPPALAAGAGRLAELGLMTAALAHEQRQPLFAIKSLAQILQRRADEASQPLLLQLLEQVVLLERIVDGIGLYARAPSGQAVPVDLGRVVEGSVEMMRHHARSIGVSLQAKIAGNLPAARGDSTALTQVLVNLVRNALDASPRGGQVTVVAEPGEGGLVLEVRDEGPGVPEALRERVFEPFFTTKPPGEGTGLGLSISRQLLADLGGSIALLERTPGLTARVWLPAWSGPVDAGPTRT